MKFFVDTANLAQIQEVAALGILDGVTTNPSLMAKEGIHGQEAIYAHYKSICNIVGKGDVSAEVLSTDLEGILSEGRALAKIDTNIVVKVPMIKEGIKAIKIFTSEGIRTNCTLIFSSMQALIAAKAGASYVSPFIGRIDDISGDGMLLIEEICTIFGNYFIDCEVLAASVRHPLHAVQCATIGADVITAPSSVLLQLLNHPLTDLGLAKFLEDAKKLS